MSDLLFSPAWELAAAVRRSEISPVTLVQACLDRIDAVNPAVLPAAYVYEQARPWNDRWPELR